MIHWHNISKFLIDSQRSELPRFL